MRLVLKYGGNAMSAPDGEDLLLDAIAALAARGDGIVLVHGGGPQIDAALAERGVVTERIEGLRVTDRATLAITESVLCGTVNKALVRALARRGARAFGCTGQDGGTIVARAAAAIAGRSLGFVGDVERVDTAALEALLSAGFLPVVAPVGISADASTPYNVNADTSAGSIAGALRADVYLVITNVDRVRRELHDPASGIAEIGESEARALLADGTFGGGMKPKMESALDALARGARSAIICGAGEGEPSRALAGISGTRIVAD